MKSPVIVLLCLLGCGQQAFAQKRGLDSLLASATTIDSALNDTLSLEVLNSAAGNFKLYVCGELHKYERMNELLQLKFFRYLHRYAGVRHLVLEMSSGEGQMAQRYIKTGDTVLLTQLRRFALNSGWFYQQLRSFYTTLPASDSFSIHGIDVDRGSSITVMALTNLLPGEMPQTDSLRFHVQALKALSRYVTSKEKKGEYMRYGSEPYNNFHNTETSLKMLARHFWNHTEEYSAYLGNSYYQFHTILVSLGQYGRWMNLVDMNASHDEVFRDKMLYDNFMHVYHRDTASFYFGQFGSCHVALLPENNVCDDITYPFVSCLNTNFYGNAPAFKHRVFNVMYHYIENGESHPDYNKKKYNYLRPEKMAKPGISLAFLWPADSDEMKLVPNYKAIVVVNVSNYNYTTGRTGREETPDPNEDESDFTTLSYDLGLAGVGVNLKKLNQAMAAANYNSLQPPLIQLRYAVVVNDYGPHGVFFEYYFTDFVNQRMVENTAFEYTAKGWGTGIHVGAQLIKQKHWHWSIAAGPAYQKGKLAFVTSNALPPFQQQTVTEYVLHNPGVLLSAQTDFRWTVDGFNLHLKGGYQYDVSKPYWLSGKNRVNATAANSWSSWFLLLGTGISITDF